MNDEESFTRRPYDEYELRILFNICRRGRWCNKHINENQLLSGLPKDKHGTAKNSLNELYRIGLLKRYKSQGRDDYCIPKANRGNRSN